MSTFLEQIWKILSHRILVHVYSSPNFIMETSICLLMCIFHCVLFTEVDKIIKDLNIPPLKITKKQSSSKDNSKQSICRKVIRNHPDLGVDIVFQDNLMQIHGWDTTAKINNILSTSFSDYVRRDLKNRPIERGDEEQTKELKTNVDALYEYLLNKSDEQKRCVPEALEDVDQFYKQ